MQFVDAAPLVGTKRTQDGYLVANARVARTGIQLYAGREVGMEDRAVVRVYRAPEEVFHRDSLASFSHVPITNDHPAEAVTSVNWKDLAVGETSDEVLRDGERLRVPLILKDAAAIALVEGGKRELSVGYTCDLAFEAGRTADGQEYDAVQKNIRANHVAIVARGRAGSEVRIGDATSWGAAPIPTPTADEEPVMPGENLLTVVVDGLSVSTTDQGAQAIEKLTSDRTALETKIKDAEKAHAEAIAAKDAELAKKDAEIDDLKGKVLDDAALDKKVQARSDLIATARAIVADVKTDGVSDADIRKAVVTAKRGEAAIKDKSQAYVDATFDILAEDAKKNADPIRHAARDGLAPANDGTPETARKGMVDHLTTAWQGNQNKGAA